jgi:hypothetical protein
MMIRQSVNTAVVLAVTISLLYCETTSAVPAIVWNKNSQQLNIDDAVSTSYFSNEIPVTKLMESFGLNNQNANVNNDGLSIMFLMGRDVNSGEESLTSITPLLQQISQLDQQPQQYLHVSGMESASHVLNAVKISSSTSSVPMIINLNELSYKLNNTHLNAKVDTLLVEMDVSGDSVKIPNKATVKVSKRNRSIEQSKFVIVTVPSNIQSELLDTTLVQTMNHPSVSTIVLSAIRSVDEVKYDRELKMRRQLLGKAIILDSSTSSKKSGTNDAKYHRRLDQNGNADNGGGGNSDLSGVYYVQMTPNIFSGILFFGLFAVVAMIGFSCMNMIAGQDVYVKTMPSIGREA